MKKNFIVVGGEALYLRDPKTDDWTRDLKRAKRWATRREAERASKHLDHGGDTAVENIRNL